LFERIQILFWVETILDHTLLPVTYYLIQKLMGSSDRSSHPTTPPSQLSMLEGTSSVSKICCIEPWARTSSCNFSCRSYDWLRLGLNRFTSLNLVFRLTLLPNRDGGWDFVSPNIIQHFIHFWHNFNRENGWYGWWKNSWQPFSIQNM
jgi:hypothetical protein